MSVEENVKFMIGTLTLQLAQAQATIQKLVEENTALKSQTVNNDKL